MKKIYLLIYYLSFILTTTAFAEKKVLDHSVYDDWEKIASTQISPDGNIVIYEVQPQEGNGELIIFNKKKNSKRVIERGHRATFLPNNQQVICLIKPLYKEIRDAKIKKLKKDKAPKDSIAIINLEKFKITKIAHVSNYKIPAYNSNIVTFTTSDTTLVKGKKVGDALIVKHLLEEKNDTILDIKSYQINSDGSFITYINKKKEALSLYNIASKEVTLLSDKQKFYSLPTFNVKGDQLLYLASTDSMKSGDKRCDLHLYDINKKKDELIIKKDYTSNLPKKWGINQNSNPQFSENGERIFVGVAPIIPPKDSTQYDFETPQLDLWHYADRRIQPMQLSELRDDLKKTYLTIYKPNTKELIPLTTKEFDRIRLIEHGNNRYALSIDETDNYEQLTYNIQIDSKLSLVNLDNGNRTFIAEGKFSRVTVSPKGKYILWFNYNNKEWFCYDIRKQEIASLTQECPTLFQNEDMDMPCEPSPYGLAGFTDNDEQALIYDKYDIWMFNLSTKDFKNITQNGREKGLTYRYLNPKYYEGLHRNPEEQFVKPNTIPLKKEILLSVFNHTSKKKGYATLKIANAKKAKIKTIEGFSFAKLRKAKDKKIFTYEKSNFNHSPNLFYTKNLWKSETQLSDINPQMKEYNWGTVELFKWRAYDGTALEGLVYKPENFDPKKKYPVISYFYEKKSDDLYQYYEPRPMWSIINISFFCSRGYVVFVPDIVYNTGIPGESAYNCICSGVEKLAENPWIDKKNIGIQGQSWGGYQVAYLVTRTNMFKAAGAGAPVSNMTSAYGGIRWDSGMSRQFQYEQTQSRIGQTLWEAPELYIANSPIFKADRVETPILIMHNDKDGAVPWYQGIEFFMGLKRLHKKAWMLQYNNEAHNLKERRNRKDLSIRLQQFFDHYLKGEPMPAWMKSGIPATQKGRYFGYETE